MPKLLSRSKHVEFKSNSALQIRDQEERKMKQSKFWSQPVKLLLLATIHPTTVHISPFLQLHAFAFLLQFLFLPILTLVIAFVLFFFLISYTLGSYISLSLYKLGINHFAINFFFFFFFGGGGGGGGGGGRLSFQLPRFCSSMLPFLLFSFPLSGLPNTLRG